MKRLTLPGFVLGSIMLAVPVSLIAVTGCQSTTSTVSQPAVTQAISDARILIGVPGPMPTGLFAAYASIKALYPSAMSTAADNQVQSLLASAPGILDSLSATADAAATAGGLRGIEAIASGVLNIVSASLASVPGVPPSALVAFQAAAVLLPFLELAANTLVPHAPTVGAAPARFRSDMSVGTARMVLGR